MSKRVSFCGRCKIAGVAGGGFSVSQGNGGMAVQLFEHNRRVHTAVEAMLSDPGKAAVIHPTGTKKPYCIYTIEAHPKEFIWPSPGNGHLNVLVHYACEDGFALENGSVGSIMPIKTPIRVIPYSQMSVSNYWGRSEFL